jgi:hypothetical protein
MIAVPLAPILKAEAAPAHDGAAAPAARLVQPRSPDPA